MPQVLIQFDEATLKAIDRIAPAAKRKRADFIRRAVKDAIFRQETDRMREAYRLQPDSVEGSDVWELPGNGKSEAVRDLVGGSARTRRPASGFVVESKRRLQLSFKFVAAEITSTIRQIASEVPSAKVRDWPKPA
jgi:hypothetical protein